jgi:ribosome-binding protein aMBF1 (putative translation factor)
MPVLTVCATCCLCGWFQESAAAPTKGRRAASTSSSKGEKRGPSARRRHFPMEGEEAHEADYDQEILDFINSWD